MALDEPKKDDAYFEDEGITFLVNKQLFDRVKPIRIEHLRAGFSVYSGNLPADDRC